MTTKVKEAPAPPKVEDKSKALKAKKAELKGVHSHTHKKIHMSHTFQRPKTLVQKAAQISLEEHPREKQA